jgi:hypothetical protein
MVWADGERASGFDGSAAVDVFEGDSVWAFGGDKSRIHEGVSAI